MEGADESTELRQHFVMLKMGHHHFEATVGTILKQINVKYHPVSGFNLTTSQFLLL